MASCELCSKPATTRAKIEGVALTVCANCAAFGTSIETPRASPTARGRVPVVETYLPGDVGARVRAARQKLGLSEKDLATRLQVKENIIRHIESGRLQPDDATTTKLERFFHLTLRQQL